MERIGYLSATLGQVETEQGGGGEKHQREIAPVMGLKGNRIYLFVSIKWPPATLAMFFQVII